MNWINLFFQDGAMNSDKVYRIGIDEDGDEFVVRAEWGRRGSSMQSDVKCRTMTYPVAKIEMNRILREKVAKGYVLLVDAIARGYLSEAEVLGYQL